MHHSMYYGCSLNGRYNERATGQVNAEEEGKQAILSAGAICQSWDCLTHSPSIDLCCPMQGTDNY